MKRKWIAVVLAASFAIGMLLTGCSDSETTEGEATVQSVSMIAGIGTTGLYDRYAGIVVSQNEVKIEKDSDKTVSELLVSEDDEVNEGDVLFRYDTEEMQYNVEKGKLELEQMKNTLTTKQEQLKKLETEKTKAAQSEQLSYTLEIQSMQADIMEQQYNISVKEESQANLEASLESADVVSPVTGRVQKISENGSDNYGNSMPYITIVETGAYRVKGTINETTAQQLQVGTSVIIRSRVDDTQTWTGTISMIDWENASTDNSTSGYYYGNSDSMTSSSKYPFYIDLDSLDGLMIGQHVYIEPDNGQEDEQEGIWLPSYYINDAESSSPWVWAASKKDKLEKRNLTLGEYNSDTDTWEVVDGLTADDYIAYPDDSLKAGMTVTKYDDEYFAPSGGESYDDGVSYDDGGSYDEGNYTEDGVDETTDGDGASEDGIAPDVNDSGITTATTDGAATGSDLIGGSVG